MKASSGQSSSRLYLGRWGTRGSGGDPGGVYPEAARGGVLPGTGGLLRRAGGEVGRYGERLWGPAHIGNGHQHGIPHKIPPLLPFQQIRHLLIRLTLLQRGYRRVVGGQIRDVLERHSGDLRTTLPLERLWKIGQLWGGGEHGALEETLEEFIPSPVCSTRNPAMSFIPSQSASPARRRRT